MSFIDHVCECSHLGSDHKQLRAIDDPYECTKCDCKSFKKSPSIQKHDPQADHFLGQPLVHETINHPSYYGGDTTYEAIKVIEAWQLDFCLGNAVKYISRAGKKDPAKEIEDLEKAAWYLSRRIEQLKTKV